MDGTTAIENNQGFVFLFNPNTRAMATPQGLLVADWHLDLDCGPGDVFLIGEVSRYVGVVVWWCGGGAVACGCGVVWCGVVWWWWWCGGVVVMCGWCT